MMIARQCAVVVTKYPRCLGAGTLKQYRFILLPQDFGGRPKLERVLVPMYVDRLALLSTNGTEHFRSRQVGLGVSVAPTHEKGAARRLVLR